MTSAPATAAVPVVQVIGTGTLARAIDRTAGADAVPPPTREDPELVVLASDAWRIEGSDFDVPVLPVRVEIGRAVIGPLSLPGVPGCHECFELRRRRASEFPERIDALMDQHGDDLAAEASPWITPLATSTISTLVAAESARVVDRRDDLPPRSSNAVLVVDLTTLEVVRHRLVPDPLCPRCGGLPADTADRARLDLRPRPKLGPATYRARDIAQDADDLIDTYVDPECGMISSLVTGTYGGVAASIASLRCRPHDAVEPGFGSARTVRSSRMVAVLEALERYAGAEPAGRASSVAASYAELGDAAVDPRTFGLHTREAYELPGFRYDPFDPYRRTRWVWGYSFARTRPVLVPEGAAFWHTHPDPAVRPYFFEVSNGCALGASIEEAILHGLLEVIERDSFLMTWYAEVPGRRIALDTRAEVSAVSSAITANTGYDVLAFDTTMEHGVPSVWVMGVHPDNKYDTAKVLCTAGAHPDPEHALVSALEELGPALQDLQNTFPNDADHARTMLVDPRHVATMKDHSVLYGAHEAFDRFDFLTRSTQWCRIDDLERSVGGRWRSEDLTEDLRELVGGVLACGMDVIVVDQTVAEHAPFDLSCVKVLVPGSLSMTFGHQHRRTDGIARLAARVGDTANPHPHPFP